MTVYQFSVRWRFKLYHLLASFTLILILHVFSTKLENSSMEKLLSNDLITILWRYVSRLEHNSEINGTTLKEKRRMRSERGKTRIKKLAILRPFAGMKSHHNLQIRMFERWESFLPCDILGDYRQREAMHLEVDIIFSYSQSLDMSESMRDSLNSIIETFNANKHTGLSSTWEQCISQIKIIECKIEPELDLYKAEESQTNRMWVHGPNQQFITSMKTISSGQLGQYDAVFLMEADVIPIKNYWLDNLLEEAEQQPQFAMLGSKYDGDSWDDFRSSLHLALLHHINGNAIYNITHPLFGLLLSQLETEIDTPYHAIPYDYRISQILVEGMLHVPPDLPVKICEHWSVEEKTNVESYADTFKSWWIEYGSDQAIRESNVISNFAASKFLPRMKNSIKASLIHGAKFYDESNSRDKISLIVSDWHEELSANLLTNIDNSNHPFSEVILMLPRDIANESVERLGSIKSKVKITIEKRERETDFMDICNAPVLTKWFMITNSYHVVSPHVDLMFTDDNRRLSVIPFFKADNEHCLKSKPCVELHEQAKQFDPLNNMIIQDFDMLFNTEMRTKFCNDWYDRYGENRMPLPLEHLQTPTTIGPSATTYVSYLMKKGLTENIYNFQESGLGKHFKRIISEKEEQMSAIYGETTLSSSILEDGILTRQLSRTIGFQRLHQFFPSYSPPTRSPSSDPSQSPSYVPSLQPSSQPSLQPSSSPSNEPLISSVRTSSSSSVPYSAFLYRVFLYSSILLIILS